MALIGNPQASSRIGQEFYSSHVPINPSMALIKKNPRVGGGISWGARKLTRTPQLFKKGAQIQSRATGNEINAHMYIHTDTRNYIHTNSRIMGVLYTLAWTQSRKECKRRRHLSWSKEEAVTQLRRSSASCAHTGWGDGDDSAMSSSASIFCGFFFSLGVLGFNDWRRRGFRVRFKREGKSPHPCDFPTNKQRGGVRTSLERPRKYISNF